MAGAMDVQHVVIGAGVIGAAAARSLAARGRSVVVLEQFGRANDRGSSHGASRIFRMGYTAPDYIAMAVRSLELWRALEAQSGESLVTLTGAVDHGRPETIDAIADALAAANVPFEHLTPTQAAARWPGLRFEGSVVAHASAGRIRADRAIEALLAAAAQDGASIRFDTPVADIAVAATGPDGAERALVTLGSGQVITTESVIVAAGSWAPALVGALLARRGDVLPGIRVTQEQPAHFATSLPDDAWPSFVHYPIGTARTPDGASVYGLFTPGEGVKVGFHGTGPVVDPDARSFRPDAEQLAALAEYVRRFVPGADADALVDISCLYDNTADEDFVLDRSGPVTVATGFSGHGFKFAPLIGEMLADLALGATTASAEGPNGDELGHARARFAFRADPAGAAGAPGSVQEGGRTINA